MTRSTALIAVLLVGLGLACSGAGPLDLNHEPDDLSEALVSLGLPLDGGRVVFLDEEGATIHFPGHQRSSLTPRVIAAVESSDCVNVNVYDSPHGFSVHCELDDRIVLVHVAEERGRTTMVAVARHADP